MKKILITGANGMLGSTMVNIFQNCNGFLIFGLDRDNCPLLPVKNQFKIDIADESHFKTIKIIPDVIIHTAAITDLKLCEESPIKAANVNIRGSANVAKLGNKHSKFIYISTDSVFNGEKGDYTEDDLPSPLNHYAFSKHKGEEAVKQVFTGKTTIIRTNIYGANYPLRNSLVEWAVKEWKSGNSILGFTDTIFNAVSTFQLTEIVKEIIESDFDYPIINVGCSDYVSKFEFLDILRQKLGVHESQLVPSSIDKFKSKIKRPKNTTLNTSLLSRLTKVPKLTEGIDHLINKLSNYENNQ
jgi:dTDP-4-dehydrorhamnose reductase